MKKFSKRWSHSDPILTNSDHQKMIAGAIALPRNDILRHLRPFFLHRILHKTGVSRRYGPVHHRVPTQPSTDVINCFRAQCNFSGSPLEPLRKGVVISIEGVGLLSPGSVGGVEIGVQVWESGSIGRSPGQRQG